MSENRRDPEFPPNDAELESLLRRLEPNPVHSPLLDELERDRESIEEALRPESNPPRWNRLIPLAFAGCLVFATYLAVQYRPVFDPVSDGVVAEAVSSGAEAEAPRGGGAPAGGGARIEGFVPVSAQGYLIDSSFEGVVETDEGPREKMNLEFRDAYHWHNPETGTNLRFFQPRSEQVTVPLQTD